MNRVQLFERVAKRWSAFKDSYAGLGETDLLTPGVAGVWSIRDLIAHVTWWEEEALAHLPVILKGGRLPRYSVTCGGIDAFNALMAERKRGLPLAEVVREQAQTHQRVLDLIREAPELAFRTETRWRRRLKADTYGHYPIHARAILQWRAVREGLDDSPQPCV